MNATVTLDGGQYEPGSTAHLKKIDEIHGVELAKHASVHAQEARERAQLEERTRSLSEQLAQVLRDQTTALAAAHAATEESETSFLRLAKGAKDYALYTLDPAGHITSWNAGAELVEGYRAEEIIGRHLSILYQGAEAKDGHAERNLALAAQTGSTEEEGWRIRKDGSAFWAEVVLSAIHDSHGTLLGFAKLTRDLTERRSWEEQLRQAQKMEAIGTLAAGVAHDFNNLLSIILSYSELLISDLKEGDPMRADLKEIQTAGSLAAVLTRQLLAFGRQQPLRPKVVDVCRTVTGMEAMLRRLCGAEVELVASVAPECGKVLIDAGQIEQVLINLTVNARDAMPEGGKLTIDVTEIVLDAAFAADHIGVKPGPHVLIAVSDSGVGMDEATRARMFDPFFTTKDPGKGTGLGLAIVFGIVKQSSGTIWVSSEPTRGTLVEIYLPLIDQAVPACPPSSPPPSQALHGSETVLLVEDDDAVRVLARAILRKYGYNVLDARGGGDAFLLCEQFAARIDLLLTDVVMPRMSGRQLAERLLKIRPEMKVLYMSGYTDDAVVRDGIFYSTVAFIQKPITPEVLVRKVRESLDAPGASSSPPLIGDT